MGGSLENVFNRFYQTSHFYSEWLEDIRRFSIFLRLFPAKNKPGVKVFMEAMTKMIIFRTVRNIQFHDNYIV